ncbi:hypothetical protein Trydic_g75 [Trypoxylus dichotomus]
MNHPVYTRVNNDLSNYFDIKYQAGDGIKTINKRESRREKRSWLTIECEPLHLRRFIGSIGAPREGAAVRRAERKKFAVREETKTRLGWTADRFICLWKRRSGRPLRKQHSGWMFYSRVVGRSGALGAVERKRKTEESRMLPRPVGNNNCETVFKYFYQRDRSVAFILVNVKYEA